MELIYDRQALIDFLHKIDDELYREAKIYIVGGSAACLAYDSKDGTKDIDTWMQEKAIEEAYVKVLKNNPNFRIHLGPIGVQISCPKMQSRFYEYTDEKFKKLKIFIPEAEDLFLMKAQRAEEKDLVDLENLNEQLTLDSKAILARFKNELLPQYFGNDELLKDNYLTCVERVFGEDEAEIHEQALK